MSVTETLAGWFADTEVRYKMDNVALKVMDRFALYAGSSFYNLRARLLCYSCLL